jgi:hypothetical protein
MAADNNIQAAERLMRLAEQATGPAGYGVTPAFLEQYQADLAAARADERRVLLEHPEMQHERTVGRDYRVRNELRTKLRTIIQERNK